MKNLAVQDLTHEAPIFLRGLLLRLLDGRSTRVLVCAKKPERHEFGKRPEKERFLFFKGVFIEDFVQHLQSHWMPSSQMRLHNLSLDGWSFCLL